MTQRMDAELATRLAQRCRGSAYYSTKVRAKHAALGVRKSVRVRLRPYRCDWCGKWHLTSAR